MMQVARPLSIFHCLFTPTQVFLYQDTYYLCTCTQLIIIINYCTSCVATVGDVCMHTQLQKLMDVGIYM